MLRSTSITNVIRALASALLVALLLEATGLTVWAERLEVGALRNIAQPVTQTWQGIVTGLHLDTPRRVALDLRDRWSTKLMPVAEVVATTENSPPVATQTSSTAETTVTVPPEAKRKSLNNADKKAAPAKTTAESKMATPVALQSAQVALVGDSMMAVGLAPVLRRSVPRESSARFVRAYRSGTGLGRPDVFNWPVQYPQLIGAARPGLVICAIGANDAQNFQVNGNVYFFGTPAWKQMYAERVRDFAKLLTRDGARVLWIGMPVMRESGFSRRMASINVLVKEVLAEFPQITWVDPNPYIAGSGGSFEQYRQDQRGKLVRLRADDGIHLSEDGAAYLLPAISGWMQRVSPGV
jgi:uncharacterized protein